MATQAAGQATGWPVAEVDTLVVGAGVVGVATAYALAERGHRVAIVDRAEGPALASSFANGGQLSYAYTDALGSPALLKKLPFLALGNDPFFRLANPFDPGLICWGLRFLRNCTEARFRSNTLAVLELALESRAAMERLLARHPIDFAHQVPGKMHLYYDAGALAGAAKVVEMKRGHAVEQHILGAAESLAIEPALAGATGLVGTVYSPGDAVGDPNRFAGGVLRLLASEYDAQSFFGFEIVDLAEDNEGVTVRDRRGREVRARRLVLCAGADSPVLARKLGISLPVIPMKGYSFTAARGAAAPRVSITDTARKLVFCDLGGSMRVAGLAELGERNPAVDPARLEALIGYARESLPQAADYDAISARWAGLRPMTPSSMPVISRLKRSVVINAGHGMLGWTLAMGAGDRAARLIDAN